jgi:large subunit ribosomal protein L3
MSLGLVGRKVGMTRIFTDDGDSVPVTVLDVSNNRVAQIKTPKPMATLPSRWLSASVALARHQAAGRALAKAGVEAGSVLKEFRGHADEARRPQGRRSVSVDFQAVGQKVDVTGHDDPVRVFPA